MWSSALTCPPSDRSSPSVRIERGRAVPSRFQVSGVSREVQSAGLETRRSAPPLFLAQALIVCALALALRIAPDWVEAAAFAWLAKRCLDKEPGNLPAVTGARNNAILGGIYWA